MTVVDFVDSNKSRFLHELDAFLRIPSISTLPERKADCTACAEHLREALTRIGMQARIMPTPGHPVVYAEDLSAGPNAPTTLFYGHYDVQPVDPLHLWTAPPFEPVVRNGKIFARGSADDKGQVHLHIKGIEALRAAQGALPCNVKIMIEGEEEIGSEHLEQFLVDNKKLLACDTVLISDTAMFAHGMPSITYALRGLAYFDVTVRSANTDLHSGMFGGVVENPINVLCDMLGGLKDKYGRITIPGFYDDALPVTDAERAQFARLPFDERSFCASIGLPMTRGEFGYTTLEQNWARPTLDINGIWGGFTGEGAKTVLPAVAHAKVSMRLVANQTPERVAEVFAAHLARLAPPTVTLEVKALHGGPPAFTPIDAPGNRAAQAALRRAFAKEPVFIRDGASIPIVALFQSILSAPVVMMGFGLPDENAHAPDENLSVENYFGGVLSSAYFYEEFAKTR